MFGYLKKTLEDFPEAINSTASTPAADHLFTVRPDGDRTVLDEERAQAFHHAVAQMLFACTRARKDIQTAVAFLTTRVREPDEDDWGKLKSLLRYVKGTLSLPLILRADSLNIVKWWVDASFAVHGDCRGHTGATMSLGKGSVTGISNNPYESVGNTWSVSCLKVHFGFSTSHLRTSFWKRKTTLTIT